MIKTLKRIPPLQLAKVLGVIYALMALIFVPIFLIVAIASAFAPSQEGMPMAAMGLTFGIIMSIAMPIFYGIFGFISGLIGAALYNLIAKWVGGIQVEVE